MNRPFAACHSRGTKPPCWNAKVVLGQDQQKAYIIWNSNFLSFSCPSATFASQHGDFVPREWQAAKVLLYQTTSVLYVIFTAILHCDDITLKNSFTDRQFSMQTKPLARTKQSLFSLLLTEHIVRKQSTQSYVGSAQNVSSCSTVESEDIKNTFAGCVGGKWQQTYTFVFSEFVKNPEGLYRLWKTGIIMKFKNFILQAWKVMEFTCRSWKIMENFKKFCLVD